MNYSINAIQCIACEAIIHPGPAPLTRYQTGVAKNAKMMRYGGLLEWQRACEIANADLVFRSSHRGEHGEAVRITQCF